MKTRTPIKSLAFAFAFGAIALSGRAAEKDIVETAVEAGSFKTLAAALGAAGLVDTLKGDGPFTVFAPTDEAFAKLPEGTVETLLKPENKDQLIDILTYHVVSGKVPSKVAVTLEEATPLNEKKLKLEVKDESLFINNAKVVTPDIDCSNGVIHVIDEVLLPPSGDSEQSSVSKEAREMMEMAITSGTSHFNHGNHSATEAIYGITAKALMMAPAGSVCESGKMHLTKAMKKTSQSHCSTTNAWTYRHAFDAMLAAE
jgi:transforming growth factor-beta-induced protein